MIAHDRHRSRRKRCGRSPRKGLTLFELLLALAIFLVSLAALAQLLASGSRAAAQAQLQTEAILRGESKLGEFVAGVEPLRTSSSGAFEDDPRWTWQLTVTAGPWPNLQLAELQVSHAGRGSLGNRSFTLRRYLRDPRLFVATEARRTGRLPPAASEMLRNNPSAPRPERGAPGAGTVEDTDR